MSTITYIKNNFLEIGAIHTGGELCSIKNSTTGKEYMWEANPDVWKGHAPVLFPIVGALKNHFFTYTGKTYQLPQHGFFRKNENVQLVEQSESHLTFCLENSEETLRYYPFQFAFYTTYELLENTILIKHRVVNKGEGPMYFSLGAHPAFKCPFIEGENYTDYSIELEQNETAHTFEITADGLVGDETDLIFNNSKQIDLHHHIFDKGALVFKNLKSRKAKLLSKKSGDILELSYDGFPYLGIWAKPQADYVCIEPWQGIADSLNSGQELTTKEGIIKLENGELYETSYSITIK